MNKEDPQKDPDSKIDNCYPEALVFRTIADILNEKPSDDGNLVGDCHIMKGAVTLIGGEPGCGKSLVALNLAIAGALKSDPSRDSVEWMGMKVNREFRTMVIQFENGTIRMHREALEYPDFDYEDRIYISNPPLFGEKFGDELFATEIRRKKEEIDPDLIIIDPWTSVSDGDHREAVVRGIAEIRRVFGSDEDSPALVIVSHTAKPKGANKQGVAMLHDIAGSFALAAHARVVFILERATPDPNSDLVRCTCAKNNNGVLGSVKKWKRRPGAFEFVEEVEVGRSVRSKSKKGGKKGSDSVFSRALVVLEELLLGEPEHKKSRQSLVAEMKEKVDCGPSTVDKCITELLRRQRVERLKNGKQHEIKLVGSSDGPN